SGVLSALQTPDFAFKIRTGQIPGAFSAVQNTQYSALRNLPEDSAVSSAREQKNRLIQPKEVE
ncbi:MAG: hypothetical protein IJO99_02210, partial [Ruminococcus sp.]|nr:hypothetical protein [Ruminococcus sp.]